MADTRKEKLDYQVLMEKLMNKAEENRLLRERIKVLEEDNLDLQEKLHKLKGNFELIVLEDDIQKTVLMEYARDKSIGNIYASLKSIGFSISIDTIKNIIYQFDRLPVELREYYDKEREYFLKSNKSSYTQQINQSVNSLVLARDTTSILIAEIIDQYQTKSISAEVAEDRLMKLTDRLIKLESSIIKSRQEDNNYSSMIRNEIKDQSDEDLQQYDDTINKLVNIDDLIKSSQGNLISLEDED
jgi:hypothetical protein